MRYARRGRGRGGPVTPNEDSSAVLDSGTVDLTGTTFIDVAAPAGKSLHLTSVMAIAEGNLDANASVNIGTPASPSLYFSNLPLAAASFNSSGDSDLIANPSTFIGSPVIRITPNGGATAAGDMKFKLNGNLNS